jgi:hypothetical protein
MRPDKQDDPEIFENGICFVSYDHAIELKDWDNKGTIRDLGQSIYLCLVLIPSSLLNISAQIQTYGCREHNKKVEDEIHNELRGVIG